MSNYEICITIMEVVIMEGDGFRICAECCNKQAKVGLVKGQYYCHLVDGILPNGVVQDDTDATECVRQSWFRSVK